jgi:hypothetical protein
VTAAARRTLPFLATGLAGEGVYLAITVRLPWLRYGSTLHSWSRILGSGWSAFAFCLGGVAVLLVAYVWGWRLVRARAVPRWAVWSTAVIYVLTLVWLLPITADLFLYLIRAHMFTDLGINPLQVAPFSLPSDSLLASYAIQYEARPTVYGPAWALLSAPSALGRYETLRGVLYLKGLAAAAVLGCAWLLEQILTEVRPAAAREGLYLFACNPLVLLMAVGDGHNDAVMMVLVLLAAWLLIRERWALAFGALALSVWIKYVSVLLFPLFVIYVWWHLAAQSRRRLRVLGAGLLTAAAVTVLVVAPFWYPDLIPDLMVRLSHPANTLMPGLSEWVLSAGLGLFAVGYATMLGWLARGPRSAARLMNTGFGVTLLVFVLGAARSQPWHMLWPTTLAGLTDKRWVWPTVIAVAAALLAGQLWVEWGTPGLELLF